MYLALSILFVGAMLAVFGFAASGATAVVLHVVGLVLFVIGALGAGVEADRRKK